MSLDLKKEAFIFGNISLLNINFSEIDLKELENYYIHVTKKILKEDKSWPWRFMKNFKILLNYYENFLISDLEKFKDLENFLFTSIKFYEKTMEIKDYNFENPQRDEDFFGINSVVVVNLFRDKMNLYKKSNKKINIDDFLIRFQNYLEDNFTYDYGLSYDDIKWTSKWKFLAKNKEITFDNVDVYLDSYFKSWNLYYNSSMANNIKALSERLYFLDKYAKNYLRILENNLEKVTEKMFNMFPYSIVYNDYKKLLFYNVYYPPLLKVEPKKNISDTRWLLSVIPNFLTAYILGFPVISMDIPGEKQLVKYIKFLESNGPEKYFNLINKEFNYNYIKSISFNIETGNGTDESNNIVDLCYNNICDFNQDDVSCLFNDNVVHYFTAKEFKTLIKKQENPYNRQDFPNLTKVIENLKFKNKVKKNLLSRGVDVELDGTLSENLEEIKSKISSKMVIHYFPHIENNTDSYYRPLLEILLQSI
jgi:hypothetical protein